MPDIDYFSLREMDKRSCGEFLNYLPSRLEKLLREEMDSSGHWKRGILSVLEYYNTHNPYNGVKKITCRWDVTAKINVIPVVGWLAYGLSSLDPSPTVTLYFDASTGEMLDEDEANTRRNKNGTAERHFERGKSYERNENFKAAYDEYKKAYQECTSNYTNESTFKIYQDQMKIEVDGEVLGKEGDREIARGNFTQAIAKYQEAYDQTNKQKDFFMDKINSVRNESSANVLKNEGDSFFSRRDYRQALQRYTEAKNISTLNKSTYITLVRKTETELTAASQADSCLIKFSAGKYEEAAQAYQQAINTSQDNNNIAHIRRQLQKAQNEQRACDFKKAGDQLFNAGEFDQASQKYESALSTSNVTHDKFKYETLVEKARNEANAASKAKSVKDLLANDDFASAEKAIISAFLTTRTQKLKDEYRKILDGIRVEKTAASERRSGDEAFEACEYKFAKEKYAKAYLLPKNQDEKTLYQSLLQSANIEIDVDKIKTFGDQAFAGNDLQKAKELFEDAIRKSEHEKHKEKLEEMKMVVVSEIEAGSYVEAARQLFNRADFKEAREELINALNKSTLASNRSAYESFLKDVNVEIEAVDQTEAGDAAYDSGDYHDAKEKYTKAWLISKQAETKENYKLLLDSVNIEIEVLKIQENAMKTFQAGNFEQATNLLSSAIEKSEHSLHQGTIELQLDHVSNEIAVNEIIHDANQLFNDQNYERAFEKYKEADHKTTRTKMRSEASILLQRCENEIKAQHLRIHGDELFDLEEFDKAVQRYQEALETSNVEAEKRLYSDLTAKAQEETNSVKEAELGEVALKNGNVITAKCQYEKAISLTKIPTIQAKYTGVLKTIGLVGEAIANNSLQTRQAAGNEKLPSKLQEQSKLLEEGLKLINKGESKGAEGKIEQALNYFEDAGDFLVSSLNAATGSIFEELKRLVTALKRLQAANETSELLEKFRVRVKENIKQIELFQAIFDDKEGATVNYSARYEEDQKNEKKEVVVLLQSDGKH